MPITYAPPEPFAPSISAAYGAAEVQQRMAPVVAQARAQQASLAASAYAQERALAERAHEGSADRLQAGIIAQGRERLAVEELAGRGQVTARDAFAAQAGMNELQARYQFQMQMQEAELSQAEKLRMQRLSQARGWINDQLTAGNITAEQANDLLMQVQIDRSPLAQRAAMTRAKAEEAHLNDFVTKSRLQNGILEETYKAATGSLKDKHGIVYDAQAIAQISGEIKDANPGMAEDEVKVRAEQEAIRRGAFHEYIMTKPGVFESVRGGHTGNEANQKAGSPKAGTAQKEFSYAGALRESEAEAKSKGIDDTHADWQKTVGEGVERRKGEHATKAAAAEGGGPKGKYASPDQKVAAVEGFDRALVVIQGRGDLDPQAQAAGRHAAVEGKRLLEKYQHPDNMPPAVRRTFDGYGTILAQLVKRPEPVTAGQTGDSGRRPGMQPAAPAAATPQPGFWDNFGTGLSQGGRGGGGGY